MINKSILVVVAIVGLFLVGGCGKRANPDYMAALNHAKEMSKEENRSVKTFEISGANITMSGVTGIIVREPMPTVNVDRPKTGYDVIHSAIGPVADVAKMALGIYGITEVADTIAEASETVVVTNETVTPIEVAGPTQIVEVPELNIVEVPTPGEIVVLEPTVLEPTVIQVPYIPPVTEPVIP